MKPSAHLEQQRAPSSAGGAVALRSLLDLTQPVELAQMEDVEWVDARIVNPIVDSSWDETVAAHGEATIFHTSAWARVLCDTYGHQPYYLQFSTNGKLLASMPLMEVRSLLSRSRGVCLPFSDYCAPLKWSSFGFAAVIRKLRQLGRERGWRYFELRDVCAVAKDGLPSETFYGHSLDLRPGSSALISNFSSSARRALRKAEQSALTASIQTSLEAMREFYDLHVYTRRQHGIPPQPRSFFLNIQKHIIDPGHGFVVTVVHKGKAIAAAVFFRFGRSAIYKFGASNIRWQNLRPNNLAMAAAIKYLAESSVETLHFGRTDIRNEGLRRFKLSFGAREHQISYGKFSIRADTWVEARRPTSTLPNRLFRLLPVPVNRLAGVLLYPHRH